MIRFRSCTEASCTRPASRRTVHRPARRRRGPRADRWCGAGSPLPCRAAALHAQATPRWPWPWRGWPTEAPHPPRARAVSAVEAFCDDTGYPQTRFDEATLGRGPGCSPGWATATCSRWEHCSPRRSRRSRRSTSRRSRRGRTCRTAAHRAHHRPPAAPPRESPRGVTHQENVPKLRSLPPAPVCLSPDGREPRPVSRTALLDHAPGERGRRPPGSRRARRGDGSSAAAPTGAPSSAGPRTLAGPCTFAPTSPDAGAANRFPGGPSRWRPAPTASRSPPFPAGSWPAHHHRRARPAGPRPEQPPGRR